MKGWVKGLIITAVVIVCTIFFGSMALWLLSYVTSFMSTLFSWISTALRWLGNVLDIFGFTGIFSASADAGVIEGAVSATKFLIGGC